MKTLALLITAFCLIVIGILFWRSTAPRNSVEVPSAQIERRNHAEPSPPPPYEGLAKAEPPISQSANGITTAAPTEFTPDMKDLGRNLIAGDTGARAELISIARDTRRKPVVRGTAVMLLGNDGTPQALSAIYEQLRDPDKSLRRAALFALPKTKRPAGYDYTSEPTPESLLLLDREKNRLLDAP